MKILDINTKGRNLKYWVYEVKVSGGAETIILEVWDLD